MEEGVLLEIEADAAAGHEQRGRRPAVVVSVSALHESLGLAIVCPVTTHGGTSAGARHPFEIPIPAGLPVSGVILAYLVRTVDLKARKAKVLGQVPRGTLLAVRSRLKVLLGL